MAAKKAAPSKKGKSVKLLSREGSESIKEHESKRQMKKMKINTASNAIKEIRKNKPTFIANQKAVVGKMKSVKKTTKKKAK